MKVLILAAGYGTRLYPYTKKIPKPLLKVNNRPIIDYLLDKVLKLEGVSSIVVVTNTKFFKYFKSWKEKKSIQYLHIINDKSTAPENRLGVIRDMELVFTKEGFDEDFLVLGGDNFFSDSLSGFIDFAKTKDPQASIGVYDVRSKKEASNYGVLSFNKNNRLVKFEEKPKAPESTLVGMCLYYFPAKKLKLIKKYLKDDKHSQDAVGNYIKWLISEDKVYGFIFRNLWYDIGRIQTYKKLKETLKSSLRRPILLPQKAAYRTIR